MLFVEIGNIKKIMMNDSRCNWIYLRYFCLNILMKFLGYWDRVKVYVYEKSLKYICID